MAARGRPTNPRAERRASVREQLLQAVTTALADGRSHADLGVNEMVEAAGIARSPFYQYFMSKNGLLTSLLDGVGTTLGATDAWLDFAQAPTAEEVATRIQRRAAAYRPYLPLMARRSTPSTSTAKSATPRNGSWPSSTGASKRTSAAARPRAGSIRHRRRATRPCG